MNFHRPLYYGFNALHAFIPPELARLKALMALKALPKGN
jgi:hypothetical protein